MKKLLLASVAVLTIAGSSAVYAQHRHDWNKDWHHHARMAPEDRAAFLDARIAAVHAGLKLTPDQEKLWPPLEASVRDFIKLRTDRANARMQAREDNADRSRDRDPVERLRQRADTMGENAAALKKIADAADPLYKTLDDGQKRRLSVLTRLEGRMGREFGAHRHHWRDDERGDRFQRGGPDRNDRGDADRDRGPERL